MADQHAQLSPIPDSEWTQLLQSKPRKRYISTGSEDECFPPTKSTREEEEEMDQILNKLLEAISPENVAMQGSVAKAESPREPEVSSHATAQPSPTEIWNMFSTGNIYMEDPESLSSAQPSHVILGNLLGLKTDEMLPISPRKRRGAMRAVVRAAVYGILDYCFNNYLYDTCEGCKTRAPGQGDHDCISWTEMIKDMKLRIVCSKICFKAVLHIVTVIAYSLKCLVLTQENIDQILILIMGVGRAAKPSKQMEKILKPADRTFLQHVEKIIKDRPYRSFFTSVTRI